MPNMDGYEATKLIKEISDVPIISLTASVMQDEHENYKGENFDGFLRKPVLKQELYAELAKFLPYNVKAPHVKESKLESFVLSDKAKANLGLILNIMSQEITPLNQKVLKSNNIKEIGKMATMIESLANDYEIDILKKYYRDLHVAIESFDIASLQKLLKDYADIEEEIANS